MRKILTVALAGVLSAAAWADEATSALTFELSNGERQVIAAQNLAITIADGTLTADNGSQALSIAMNELSRFYFTETSGVEGIEALPSDGPVEVYNAAGVLVGRYDSLNGCRAELPAGVYVAKTAVSSFKIVIR